MMSKRNIVSDHGVRRSKCERNFDFDVTKTFLFFAFLLVRIWSHSHAACANVLYCFMFEDHSSKRVGKLA